METRTEGISGRIVTSTGTLGRKGVGGWGECSGEEGRMNTLRISDLKGKEDVGGS